MTQPPSNPLRSGPAVAAADQQPRGSSDRAGVSEDAISPYGGALMNHMVNAAAAEELKVQSRDWPSWDLTPRQLCDLELLLNGGFSPLRGFLGPADYDRVCREMRLADGTLWPIPVVLDVSEAFAGKIQAGTKVALRDPEGVMLAVLTAQEIWRPDRVAEAEAVCGTTDTHHAGVKFLLEQTGPVYLGGKVEGLQLPFHHDFQQLRHTPGQLREIFRGRGWHRVVAFQTRNPMHRAHFEMTLQAAGELGANLLIHPAAGMTKPGDVDHFCRVRCYQALMPRYPEHLAALSLLPLSMRMAGPREAVWHAIIRRNYGASHLIVGRDHAGPGSDRNGRAFYEPYAAQETLLKHEAELGISTVPFSTMVYCPDRNEHLPVTRIPPGSKTLDVSGTELRERLADGREIPEWFTFPEVAAELRKTYPPRRHQGFTIFFTGLSGSGKSTLAKALLDKLLEIGGRPVTLLDGDIVRKNLSSELGFSREHRNLNILRIGFVASEITKNRGVAICAPIAPYDDIRQQIRKLISSRGGFILVHVSTSLEVCEQRDRKGLYAKARAGIVKEFTGISDPYEAPADAEVVLNTAVLSVEEGCQAILGYLETAGYLSRPTSYVHQSEIVPQSALPVAR
jgi:sulfate adenylyltransferase